jgi:DNA-binding beta-propeller fold protein YncE
VATLTGIAIAALVLAGGEDVDGTATPSGTAVIDVARGPVALDAATDRVWVVAREGDVVQGIDPQTNERDGGRLEVESPRSIAVGFGSVWVVDRDRLLRFGPGEGDEPSDGDPVDITGFEDPSDVAVDTEHGYVWVTDRGPQGRVVRVDPETNEITGDAVVGPEPRAVAVGEGGVWVANAGDGTVSHVDPGAASTVGRPIDVGQAPTDVAVGAGGVWAVDNFAGTLVRIDPADDVAAEPVETGARPRGVAVGLGSVWVTSSEEASVWRYDAADPTNRTEVVEVGEDPADVDVGATSVWTADFGSSTVTRIDPRD